MTRADLAQRNADILRWYEDGVKMWNIAARTRLTYRQIYHVLQRHRIKLRGWQDKKAA